MVEGSLKKNCNAATLQRKQKKNKKKLVKHSKTAIRFSYLCSVKIKMRGDALAREKNLPRALRNSAPRDRKTDIGMATMRVK